MVSTPKPESAASQAQAQSGLNRDTALTQQAVNMVNQVTPDGNLTYSQNGTSSFVDSKGKTVYTPTYTATTTLSPQQQAIKAQTDQASLNLGTLAAQQSKAISDQLSKPFSFDAFNYQPVTAKPFSYTTSDAENMAYDLGKKRLDPQFAQQQDQLRSQLIASGIRPGTEAYDQQMAQFGQTRNDAYDQLALGSLSQGYNQALSTYQQSLATQQQQYNQALGAHQQNYQEALTEYNNPVNAIGSLMSGSQVQNPSFVSTPTASISSPDYIGASNANYQAQLKNSQATMGGLFGLASAGIGLLSDRRAKTDIARVGTLDNGLPVYLFRYKGSADFHIGLMADEVEVVAPEAVTMASDGFKRVRYDLAAEAA